jgi:large subunit ribosomal protein L18Ae
MPIYCISERKMRAKGTLKEYTVIGRKLPTESEPVTPLYR